MAPEHRCRLCKKTPETIRHITAGCDIVYWNICAEYGLETPRYTVYISILIHKSLNCIIPEWITTCTCYAFDITVYLPILRHFSHRLVVSNKCCIARLYLKFIILRYVHSATRQKSAAAWYKTVVTLASCL